MDYIPPADGELLSISWPKYRNDPNRRQNFFRGIAGIFLSLARIPAPRIGSLKFHYDGTISLTNRPLSCSLVIQESQGAKRVIPPGKTYSTVESYALDILSCHDNRFLAQPNAVNDEVDCHAQLGAAMAMRAILPHYLKPSLSEGPFVFGMTDFHMDHLLVDDDWNVQYLIDLEYICALPIQMWHPPRFLTGRNIDQITGEHLKEYSNVRAEFTSVLKEMESSRPEKKSSLSLADVMDDGWETGRFWYSVGLTSVNGCYSLFMDHVYWNYSKSPRTKAMFEHLSRFWSQSPDHVVMKKLVDRNEYDLNLKRLFDSKEQECFIYSSSSKTTIKPQF